MRASWMALGWGGMRHEGAAFGRCQKEILTLTRKARVFLNGVQADKCNTNRADGGFHGPQHSCYRSLSFLLLKVRSYINKREDRVFLARLICGIFFGVHVEGREPCP